jgi:hypothetical protein
MPENVTPRAEDVRGSGIYPGCAGSISRVVDFS